MISTSKIEIVFSFSPCCRYSSLLNLKFSMSYQSSYRQGTKINSSAQLLLRENRSTYDALLSSNRMDVLFYQHALSIAQQRYTQEDKLHHLDTLPHTKLPWKQNFPSISPISPPFLSRLHHPFPTNRGNSSQIIPNGRKRYLSTSYPPTPFCSFLN
jgi:hypothetical protein